jgi:hypothetical protein
MPLPHMEGRNLVYAICLSVPFWFVRKVLDACCAAVYAWRYHHIYVKYAFHTFKWCVHDYLRCDPTRTWYDICSALLRCYSNAFSLRSCVFHCFRCGTFQFDGATTFAVNAVLDGFRQHWWRRLAVYAVFTFVSLERTWLFVPDVSRVVPGR